MSKIYILKDVYEAPGIQLVNRKLAYLTEEALHKVGEYSCSLPTGTTLGKIWARNDNAFTPDPIPDWWLGQYVDDPDPKQVGIIWRKIEIRPKCLTCDELANFYYCFKGSYKALCDTDKIGATQLANEIITREEYETHQLMEV